MDENQDIPRSALRIPPLQDGLSFDEASHTWSILSGHVEKFVSAWEAGKAVPAVGDFIPAHPAILRRLVLIELIKVDLEYRWLHRNQPRRIEDYLSDFPELLEGEVPCALLYEEFQVRKQAGDAPTVEEYLHRFPRQAEALERLLDIAASGRSTTLVRQASLEQIEPGQHLEGFDLLNLLGKGAFARVFLCWQKSLRRLVALKVSADEGTEPETLAQLDHDHIVRVFDQRLLPERHLRLLYMEYVAGGTLQDLIADARALPPGQRKGALLLECVDRALKQRGESSPVDASTRQRFAILGWPELVAWLGACLAQALDYAHGQGVLHRDIKPANVLLTARGTPKLADFNVSFSSKLEGASPTAFFGGSLAYMSPEQIEACNPAHPRLPESLDHRSDLYSLGVMLWELLTTSRPFRDDQLQGSWTATLEHMTARRRAGPGPEALASLPPDCPAALKRILTTCLAPDPRDRYHSGNMLARELLLCLQPGARDLFDPAPSLWRRLVLRFPVLAVLLVGLLPNALAALFNFDYNRNEIIERLHHLPEVIAIFWHVQLVINSVAFPVGIVLAALLTWPVARAVRSRRGGHGQPIPPQLRHRCLMLGHWLALLCLVEWLLAGLAYPISIHRAAGPIPLAVYIHFFVSLTLCGLIAVVYPFFGITWLSVRVYYPFLIQPAVTGSEDLSDLTRLTRRTWFYLLLAASVPMLAVTALIWAGSQNQFALEVLSGAGLVGFGLVFLLARKIQSDVATLTQALQPSLEVLN